MNNHYYRRKLQSIFSFEDQIVPCISNWREYHVKERNLQLLLSSDWRWCSIWRRFSTLKTAGSWTPAYEHWPLSLHEFFPRSFTSFHPKVKCFCVNQLVTLTHLYCSAITNLELTSWIFPRITGSRQELFPLLTLNVAPRPSWISVKPVQPLPELRAPHWMVWIIKSWAWVQATKLDHSPDQ